MGRICICCGLDSGKVSEQFMIDGGKLFRSHKVRPENRRGELLFINRVRHHSGLAPIPELGAKATFCVQCLPPLRWHIRDGFRQLSAPEGRAGG